MQVISAMVDGDYMSLVKTRPVGQWRETLAVLATYTGARSRHAGLLGCELHMRQDPVESVLMLMLSMLAM
jgi:hypothetical protein